MTKSLKSIKERYDVIFNHPYLIIFGATAHKNIETISLQCLLLLVYKPVIFLHLNIVKVCIYLGKGPDLDWRHGMELMYLKNF